MKRILATIIMAILLVGLFSPAALAAPLTRGGLTVIDKDNFEAQTIEYFETYDDVIFIDCPEFIINRVLQPDGTMDYKVDWNIITNPSDGDDVAHEIAGTGAYISLDNIIRESSQKTFDTRVVKELSQKTGATRTYETTSSMTTLFSKGPVTVTFHGGETNNVEPLEKNYANFREICKYTAYMITRGTFLYMGGTIETGASKEDLFVDWTDLTEEPVTTTKVLTEPGLYSIHSAYRKGMSGNEGPGIVLYILDGTEDMTDSVQATATAISASAKVNVNGKAFNVPAYNIAGSNYLNIRDIAYILNGTSKQFDVVYSERKRNATEVMSTHVLLKELTPYTSVGGEMTQLKGGNKTADLTAQTFSSARRMTDIFPLAYSIDGSNYLLLQDIAKIIDFGVSYDNATGTILIDTNKGYGGTEEKIPQNAVQADYKLYSVTNSGYYETYTINGERYWRLRDFAGRNGFAYFGYVHDTTNNTLTIDTKYRELKPPLGPKIIDNPEWAAPASPLVIKGDTQFTLSGYEIRQELYFTIPDIQNIYNFYIEWIADDRYPDGGFYFIDYTPENGIDRPLFWGTFPGEQ
ncbi:MAG: hypothetical protein VB106_20760 [Clostridiaceae bacterium]|nr:hypothetical protein [Clostridiaceae bacterium]